MNQNNLKSDLTQLNDKFNIATPEQFEQLKLELAQVVKDSSKFSNKKKIEILEKLKKINQLRGLQEYFYSLILALEVGKVIKAQKVVDIDSDEEDEKPSASMLRDDEKEQSFLEEHVDQKTKDYILELNKYFTRAGITYEQFKKIQAAIFELVRIDQTLGKNEKIFYLTTIRNSKDPKDLKITFYKIMEKILRPKKKKEIKIPQVSELSQGKSLSDKAMEGLEKILNKKDKMNISDIKKNYGGQMKTLKLNKLAQALLEIANDLDQKDPEMAAEADNLLQDILNEAKDESSSHLVNLDHLNTEPESIEVDETDSLDPEIEEITEPKQEYDMVSMDDIKSRLENMKWRIADKKGREALEQSIEFIEKAQKYHDAKKRNVGKAHEIFEGAGLQLRLKDFE